jgi:hypothetical protein
MTKLILFILYLRLSKELYHLTLFLFKVVSVAYVDDKYQVLTDPEPLSILIGYDSLYNVSSPRWSVLTWY